MNFLGLGLVGITGMIIKEGWRSEKQDATFNFVYEPHNAICNVLSAQTKENRMYSQTNNDDDEDTVREFEPVYKPGTGNHQVTIEGINCTYSIHREWQSGSLVEASYLSFPKKYLDLISNWVSGVIKAYVEGIPGQTSIYTVNGNYWFRQVQRPGRSINTIEHPDNSHIKLLETIKRWEASEEQIIKSGQNFHFGALLYGPPGSGKTSTAIALGHELNRPIYLFTPDMWESANVLSAVPPKSILLIEECEQVFPSRMGDYIDKHEQTITSADVASILSTMDGPLSPYNIVRLYTTNHREKLDPALLRAGRIDTEVEFPERKSINAWEV